MISKLLTFTIRKQSYKLQVMLQEAQENKKVYDEADLNEEIVKLKQKHLREPGMEDNPPPSKKLKHWHSLKSKKRKKTKDLENFETFETREDVTAPAIEKAFNDLDYPKDNDEETRKFNPFPVFVFNATKKNVKVENKTRIYEATKSRRKGKASYQKNNLLSYFKTSRGSRSNQTGFTADNI